MTDVGGRPGEMRYAVFYEKFHWVKKIGRSGDLRAKHDG
ncbi:MAG: hypothetical protein SRB1_01846 [Desulfobacteraceae bacterium Eth-SRB1]|nr:MAG: hypothetical protein SRB1_01846 [Desulfobacteraceae bacterium Eth-SRB1]